MAHCEVVEDELLLDWKHLLENLPDGLNFDFPDQTAIDGWSGSPDSACSLSIGDIQQYLMNDECNHPEAEDILADGFLSDVLVVTPPESESDRAKDSSDSTELVEVETEEEEKEQDKHQSTVNVSPRMEDSAPVEENDDPDAKKRERRLRNKDAAARSRERHNMRVRDLELKSKYYEAECKRLGIILQSFVAENQALRLSLHNSKAFDASMTKQESAVLLLESLLLGSLLGFLGIIYLLILPSHALSTLEASLVKNEASAEWESVPPRKPESKVLSTRLSMLGKRCKASRSRMRLRLSPCIC